MYRRHNTLNHSNRPPVLCQICGQEFRSQGELKNHTNVRHEDPQFKCTLCDRMFHKRVTLSHHMKVHADERKHVCSYCPKAFFVKKQLQEHLNTHLGLRPFPCPHCPDTFAGNGDLFFKKICYLLQFDVSSISLMEDWLAQNLHSLSEENRASTDGCSGVSSPCPHSGQEGVSFRPILNKCLKSQNLPDSCPPPFLLLQLMSSKRSPYCKAIDLASAHKVFHCFLFNSVFWTVCGVYCPMTLMWP
ncbi:unnamed protein product [Cyprideis torosa]|uniref:Uncharacterized protein n=1 Tax=Cyprideis torosa TaxID=163714 RepID=A0A7R8WTT3_9CRUS|nr:unnamed protein product [Cyprideis torosa]CAG0906176.1 unnamed protein product [Cyprideis torosa]